MRVIIFKQKPFLKKYWGKKCLEEKKKKIIRVFLEFEFPRKDLDT